MKEEMHYAPSSALSFFGVHSPTKKASLQARKPTTGPLTALHQDDASYYSFSGS